jgi:hypothetical protein
MATGDTASDPFSRPWPNEGEEGSITPGNKTAKILARAPQPGSDIVKEHGRTGGRDAQ